jgi:hypothetical protein
VNPADHDVTPTPIEQVQTGWSLIIRHDGHAILFQVENKKFNYTPDTGMVWTLESEPVEGGEPLRIQGPSGTVVNRVTRKR